jgi:acetoin utilization deacetylase AcuC-like enzyme
MDSRPLIVRDERFREHRAEGPHPERPERLDAIDRGLAALAPRLRDQEPRPATDEELLRVHTLRHLERLRALDGSGGQIDADTFASARSHEVARLAAGGSIDAALRVAAGEARSAFALVRPPGHHAEAEQAMGFCLLNNVAVTARALQRDAGLERIAIVDWDVHHGQGTQHHFEAERDTLFVSLHQFPLYPGTGAVAESGRDGGLGTTVNAPLPAGCGDAEYLALFGRVVVPILEAFRPEMILVSAGFDAHERDPLAGMCVTSDGFGAMAAELRAVADRLCGGRLMLLLEGGYDLTALAESVAAVTGVLANAGDAPDRPAPAAAPPARPPTREWYGGGMAGRLADALREAHARHWPSLRGPPAG